MTRHSDENPNYHEFKELPPYTAPVWSKDGKKLMNDADPYKWSGSKEPPAIGTEVKIYLNNLKVGVVLGYFAEYGWLGVLVRLTDPPDWWKKQNPTNPPGHLFGLDLEPRKV